MRAGCSRAERTGAWQTAARAMHCFSIQVLPLLSDSPTREGKRSEEARPWPTPTRTHPHPPSAHIARRRRHDRHALESLLLLPRHGTAEPRPPARQAGHKLAWNCPAPRPASDLGSALAQPSGGPREEQKVFPAGPPSPCKPKPCLTSEASPRPRVESTLLACTANVSSEGPVRQPRAGPETLCSLRVTLGSAPGSSPRGLATAVVPRP